MSARDDALLTVIVPTLDLRGRAADRVRRRPPEAISAREHYRVIVVAIACKLPAPPRDAA